MKKNRWMLASMVLAMAACGGGEGGAGTFNVADVSDTKTVNELSAAEVQKVCDAADAFVKSFISDGSFKTAFCKGAGIGAGAGSTGAEKATCEQVVTECNKSLTIKVESRTCPKPANCPATVAEIEACLNDQSKQQSELASKVPSCSSVDFKTFDPETLFESDDPPSCVALEKKCPDGEELANPDVEFEGFGTGF